MKEMDKSEDIEDKFPYRDILDVRYPFPLKKERQSMSHRAGQFAPFAALPGYGDGCGTRKAPSAPDRKGSAA